VVRDKSSASTTLVVNGSAPRRRVAALAQRVRVLVAPGGGRQINLRWLLQQLGSENVTNLLVEGGGEVNGGFLLEGLAQRVAFFYAPKILGGHDSRRAAGGQGARTLAETLSLTDLEWRRLGPDWLLCARVAPR
jgi:diaminohydroxyphosphoribosylaminopyrimidine deaminase/5-amino-6-(5-phosphoribosylamino)uracil reductase